MVDETISQLLGDLLLQGLDLGIDELDHLAGLDVDEVVMVRFGHRFIARATVTEIVAVEYAGFLEQADSAVDRRDRDALIDLVGTLEQQFDVRVILAFGQHPRDHAALFGDAQSLVCAKLFEIDLLVQFCFPNEKRPVPLSGRGVILKANRRPLSGLFLATTLLAGFAA